MVSSHWRHRNERASPRPFASCSMAINSRRWLQAGHETRLAEDTSILD
jgi:hypothetical protein